MEVKPGDSVAVIGPGPIGILAAMLADRAGAHKVIVRGLAADEVRLDMVRRMGYEVVVTDREDPVEAVRSRTACRGVELALDVSGGRGTLRLALDLVRLGGQIGIIALWPEAPFNPTTAAIKEVTLYGSYRRQPSTWFRAIKLVASRKIDVRPLITHRVPVAKAKEVFEILLHREGIKGIITPD